MRVKHVFILAASGLILLVSGAFAFSLYDIVAGASASGSNPSAAARNLDFSGIGPTAGARVAVTDISGSDFGPTVSTASIYPAPLGSARCWIKQGRVQPGQSPAFKVKVRDTAGESVSAVPVAFSIFGETGVTGSDVVPSSALTGASAIASTIVTVGSLTDAAGFVQVQAVAGGGANTVVCQAVILVR